MDSVPSTPTAVVRVTQAVFLWRLVALFLVAVYAVAQPYDPMLSVAAVLVGLPTVPGLFSPRYRELMTRHPSLVLADLLLLSAAVALVGVDTPLLLAPLTTGLLVGLWVRPPASPLIMISLFGLYLLLLARRPLAAGELALRLFVLPAVLLLLWMLGEVIRRASVAEAESRAVLLATMTAAASSEERLRVAQDLHDTFAKTLQAIRLSVAALPSAMQAPPRASAIVADLDEMCETGVAELRGLMGGLRRSATDAPLPTLVGQILSEWERHHAGPLEQQIDPDAVVSGQSSVFALVMGLQEALENIRRHAPDAPVSVRLSGADDQVRLEIVDRGPGCDPAVAGAAADRGHYGVRGMHERIAEAGGRCSWTSAPGQGTRVEFVVRRRDLRQPPRRIPQEA